MVYNLKRLYLIVFASTVKILEIGNWIICIIEPKEINKYGFQNERTYTILFIEIPYTDGAFSDSVATFIMNTGFNQITSDKYLNVHSMGRKKGLFHKYYNAQPIEGTITFTLRCLTGESTIERLSSLVRRVIAQAFISS